MQLSPLQSRLVASIIASFLILLVYLFLSSPHFALAAELNSIPLDHDAGINVEGWALDHTPEEAASTQTLELRGDTYEPDFGLFDRGIIGRAPPGVISLVNNIPNNQNINPGSAMTFVFEMASVAGRETGVTDGTSELRKRSNGSPGQDAGTDEEAGSGADIADGQELTRRATGTTRTLWISANTCIQPDRGSGSATTTAAPQLTLYISTSSGYTTPGPSGDPAKQSSFAFNEGAVMYNTSLTGDVYFSVAAPNISITSATSTYNVDVAASVDQSYHTFDSTSNSNLVWVDSDANASLMITGNLTDSSNRPISTPPYTMFAYTQGDPSVVGIRNSYCGLKLYAQIGGSKSTLPANTMTTGMTQRGAGNVTRQEFYFKGLNSSTTYMGILARDKSASSSAQRDGVPGGGGTVFQPTAFDTKPVGACTVVFNLTFCDQTAYAVPGNATNFPDAVALGEFYDDFAQEMYDNFNKSMQQIQCEAPDIAKYSLARGCDDCRAAYKDWVCSVAIPRCEDFSATEDYLQPRNINAPFGNGTLLPQSFRDTFGTMSAYSSSRVSTIDTDVQPGPYKEVLPCDDLCNDLVQSCPASMGFACPLPGSPGFNTSYGQRQTATDNVTCNYPGSAHFKSASPLKSVSLATLAGLAGSVLLLLL